MAKKKDLRLNKRQVFLNLYINNVGKPCIIKIEFKLNLVF